MPEWITPVVTVVAIFISFILGSWQSRASYDKQQKQLRYDEFYVPFIKKLYTNTMYETPFSYNKVLRKEFITLVLDNLQHLDIRAQEIFPKLYEYYIVTSDKEFGSMETNIPEINLLNKTFATFSEAVIKESTLLCKALHIPELGHTYKNHRSFIRNVRFKEQK